MEVQICKSAVIKYNQLLPKVKCVTGSFVRPVSKSLLPLRFLYILILFQYEYQSKHIFQSEFQLAAFLVPMLIKMQTNPIVE